MWEFVAIVERAALSYSISTRTLSATAIARMVANWDNWVAKPPNLPHSPERPPA